MSESHTPKVRLRPGGGLLLCCLQTLEERLDIAEREAQEGDTIVCQHHDPADQAPTMIMREGAWELAPPVPPPKRRKSARKRRNVQLPKSGKVSSNMTITIHAQERMEERWPELVEGLSAQEIGRLIQGEINDALIAGRHGAYCPLELANKNTARWQAREDGWYCWTEDKTRGYACRESKEEGLMVMTTLVGDTREQSKQKLKRW